MARMPGAVAELRRELGTVLAGYRRASPLNQGDIARLTNYSRTSISHIEAGRQFPAREFWQTVDQALGVHGGLLAYFDRVCAQERQLKIAELQVDGRAVGTHQSGVQSSMPRCDEDWQYDDVNRREVLRLMALTSSLLAVPALDIDRLRYGAERPRYLDQATVVSYEQLNASLWEAFSRSRAKREVLPLASKQLGTLNRALNEPQGSALRQQLSALAGDLFQLCGEIFFDSDFYADAAHCYALAAYASKEARHADLWACAMARHAYISIYERQYRDAVPLLDGAAKLALRGDQNRSTRFWVAAVQAQTFAGLGNLAATERALHQAEQVTKAGASRTSGWLRFEGGRLDEERGACYVALGRSDLAEPVLLNALEKELSIRRRGGVLTDLAIVGAQRGDVDQVLMYGAAALDTVRQTGSRGYVGRKVADLRRTLKPHLGGHHMRSLDTQIRETIAVSARR